ncbi:MAG: hypothetical protein IJ191_08185 [Treponema sp.]|nr:hypothetical protein [Treponema sp.]
MEKAIRAEKPLRRASFDPYSGMLIAPAPDTERRHWLLTRFSKNDILT